MPKLLPEPDNFSVTKPVQTSVSAADVASPYVEIAHSLDKAGEALNSFAIDQAREAGEAAGQKTRVDDNGNIIVDKAPFLVGPAAPEYRRSVTMSAAIKMEPQIQNKLLQMRLDHLNDPEGFTKEVSSFGPKLSEKIDDQHLKVGIDNMVAHGAAQNFRSLLVETNNNNIKDTLFNYETKLSRVRDEMMSIDRQGGGYDPQGKRPPTDEYIRLAQTEKQLSDEMAGDKRLGVSREKADALIKDRIDQGVVQSIIGDAQRLPGADILEKKQYLYNRVWGPEGDKLKLSPRQRDAAVAEGIKSFNILDAHDREAISDSYKAANKYTTDVFHNPGMYSETVRQSLMENAVAKGDVKGLHVLQALPLFKDVIGFAKSQPANVQTQIISDFINEGKLPTGMPISNTAPVRPAAPNVDPIALSPAGYLGAPPGVQGLGGAPFQPGEFPQPTMRGTVQGVPGPTGRMAAPVATQMYGGLPRSFVEKIRESEGFDPVAKSDYKQFSYGHGAKAPYAGAQITRQDADRLLDRDLKQAASIVDKVNPNLDPGTRAALTSLTFNAGESWTNSTLGQQVRAGDLAAAKQTFLRYNKAGDLPRPALQTRRASEASWFGGTEAPPGPAASPTTTAAATSQPGARINFGDGPHMANMFVSAAEELRKLSAHNANQGLSTVEDKLNKGLSLAPNEASDLLNSAQVSGDQSLVDKIMPMLAAAEAKGLVAPGDSAAVRQQIQAGQSGRTGAEYTLGKTVVDSLQKGEEFKRNNIFAFGAMNLGTPPPNPMHVGNAPAALGELLARDKTAGQIQQIDGTTGPISLVMKDEAANIGSELTSGKPEDAAAFLTGLHSVSEGNYFSTLNVLKDAITDLSHSNDPMRMGAGFNTIASAWQRNAAAAEEIFKGHNIDRMMTYRGLQGFLTAPELVQAMNAPIDTKTVQGREEEAKKLTATLKPEDVAYKIGSSWSITPEFIGRMRFNPFASMASTPAVPPPGIGQFEIGGIGADVLNTDYKRVLTAFMVKGVDPERAQTLAAERLKNVWMPSEVGGNVLMKRAPEIYYPKVGESYDYMKDHIVEVMTQQLGPRLKIKQPAVPHEVPVFGEGPTNWIYRGLVADPKTEFEIKAGQLPSYKVVYEDANGQLQAMPGRINWDPGTLGGAAYGPQLEPNAPPDVAPSGPLGEDQAKQKEEAAKYARRYRPNPDRNGPRWIPGAPP